MRRLLDVGEDYIDPGNPCEPYVCEVSADTQAITLVYVHQDCKFFSIMVFYRRMD